MGFTGSLVLARTPSALIHLAGQDAELVGHRDDGWQLAAVDGHPHDAPGWAAALVDATTSPVLIAVVSDSDTALLLADSPGGHRWSAALNAPDSSTPSSVVAATVEVALEWAAEAGQSADADAVLDALCAADRDNQAADQAMIDATGDIARMTEIVRNQISFIEVYVLRVLATLDLAVPVHNPGSWWAHLAAQADSHFPG